MGTGDTKRSWVRDLRAGTDLEGSFAVRSVDVRQRRGGGPYLAATIGDRTGEVTANQQLQVVVRQAEALPDESVEDALFVRSSAVDPAILWEQLNGLIEEVGDSDVRQLLLRIFSDPEAAKLFRSAPAARSMHHAFRSGLLEHTVSVTTVARLLARHYGLNQDLVVAGCLLHDFGKIWELEIGTSIEYTDDGRLIGHIPMETLFVDKKIGELENFPAETRRQLLHILLAHHGEYEFGSPRRPKTPEALLVHMTDNLDSKMAGMIEAIAAQGSDDEAWTPYSRILERHIYRRQTPSNDSETE
jgi:3'-5' exoribonuclease